METEVGKPLFDRVGKRVLLTEAGETLLPYALRTLKEIDEGMGQLAGAGPGLLGDLRIGVTHTFNIAFIPECVAQFTARHPTVRVIVSELSAADIVDKVRDATLDFGITYRPDTPSELQFDPLYEEEMVLVVSNRHPLAHRRRIRMVELHRQRLVLLPREFTTRLLLDECFRECGAEPIVGVEMNAIGPMLGLVSRTDMGAIVAVNAVPKNDVLKVILIEHPNPARTSGLLFKRDAPRSPSARSFLSIVRKLALAGTSSGAALPAARSSR